MISSNALYCLDRLLREIQNNDIPFGSKVFILGGDFQQVIPVIPHAVRAIIIKLLYLLHSFRLIREYRLGRKHENKSR